MSVPGRLADSEARSRGGLHGLSTPRLFGSYSSYEGSKMNKLMPSVSERRRTHALARDETNLADMDVGLPNRPSKEFDFLRIDVGSPEDEMAGRVLPKDTSTKVQNTYKLLSGTSFSNPTSSLLTSSISNTNQPQLGSAVPQPYWQRRLERLPSGFSKVDRKMSDSYTIPESLQVSKFNLATPLLSTGNEDSKHYAFSWDADQTPSSLPVRQISRGSIEFQYAAIEAVANAATSLDELENKLCTNAGTPTQEEEALRGVVSDAKGAIKELERKLSEQAVNTASQTQSLQNEVEQLRAQLAVSQSDVKQLTSELIAERAVTAARSKENVEDVEVKPAVLNNAQTDALDKQAEDLHRNRSILLERIRAENANLAAGIGVLLNL